MTPLEAKFLLIGIAAVVAVWAYYAGRIHRLRVTRRAAEREWWEDNE